MVHTLPDYTSKWKINKVTASTDNSELAARLGSIDTYDRRGNIIWMDDFESATQRWTYLLDGGRGSIVTSAEKCWMGSSSYKIVTGAQVDDYAYITKYFSIPSSSRIGIELHVHPVGTLNTISVFIYGDDGVNQYNSELYYDVANDTVSYLNSGGGYTPLKTDVLFVAGEDIWIPLKLVIDWDTKKYIRAIVEDLDTDLSAQALQTGATTGLKNIIISIRFKTTVAAAKTMYLDNVIFTQNEL
jgi:hypothetical protein